MADPAAAKDLFEPSSSSVLQQIETLINLQVSVQVVGVFPRRQSGGGLLSSITTLQLKEDEKLPRFMCQECQHDLQIAIDFRRVCIEAQELLELQLRQVAKEEEAFEDLAEQWLDDCPEEYSNLSPLRQNDDGSVESLHRLEPQDGDFVDTMSMDCKDEFPPEDCPNVAPEFPTYSQLSDEKFDLQLSPEPEPPSPQESEGNDNPDSSIHTCSKCGLEFDTVDELTLHKYHLHDVPPNTK